MMSPPIRVWIVRRGNGRAQVTPSPVQLPSGAAFSIRNLTDEDAQVAFAGHTVDPGSVTIPARATVAATIVAPGPLFFEYDVRLTRSGNYAEGGSRPGVIVDG